MDFIENDYRLINKKNKYQVIHSNKFVNFK